MDYSEIGREFIIYEIVRTICYLEGLDFKQDADRIFKQFEKMDNDKLISEYGFYKEMQFK